MDDVYWAVAEMEILRTRVHSVTHENPTAWLMGITEYERLKKTIKDQLKEEDKEKFGELEHFQGIPVIIKSTSGIEVALTVQAAEKFKEMSRTTAFIRNKEGAH